jgi:hypothetical protein
MRKKRMSEESKVYPARVVHIAGESALVEWQAEGKLRRCVLPVGLAGAEIDAETLELGAPYGLPWEEIVTLQATPEALAENLRRAGIWTLADMARNGKAVFGALQATYGVDLAALIQAANGYKVRS